MILQAPYPAGGQDLPILDARRFGVTGGDDTAAYQSLFDAAANEHRDGAYVLLAPLESTITGTITVQHVARLRVLNPGGQGKWFWRGGPTGPLLDMHDCFMCQWHDPVFINTADHPLDVMVQQYQSPASQGITATHNVWQGAWVSSGGGNLGTAFLLGGPGAQDVNNDYTVWRDCLIAGYQHFAWDVRHYQSYGNLIQHSSATGTGGPTTPFSEAALRVYQGQASWEYGSTNGNDRVIWLVADGLVQPMTFRSLVSEGDRVFYDCGGAAQTVEITGNRFAGNWADDTRPFIRCGDGTTVIRSNVWYDGDPRPNAQHPNPPQIYFEPGYANRLDYENNTIITTDPANAGRWLWANGQPTQLHNNTAQGSTKVWLPDQAMQTIAGPSVLLRNARLLQASNPTATTLTTITPYSGNAALPVGWEITLVLDGNTTLAPGGNLRLAGNTAWAGDGGATWRAVWQGGQWLETGRSA